MIVESSNPAHSLANSASCREAFESLELMVVIDVAMTETARLAHYVLPAATQFEKPEATFFNLEFPHNTFQLRHPLLEPLPGTLAEPEIWARLVHALGIVDEAELKPLRDAAKEGRAAYAHAFIEAISTNPTLARLVPFVLYETLGPTLPQGLSGAAALWGLAQKAVLAYPEAVRRAGHADGNALFDAILQNRSGVTFTVHDYEDDFDLVSHANHKIALDMPEMLDEIHALLDARPALTTQEFPIVLSAGERRAYTANDIFRDPAWRKRDADGALRVSVEDAEELGLVDGGRARITTAAGSAEASVEVSEAMLPGHASLPNGFGLDFTDDDGRARIPGVAPNTLTSTDWRDAYRGHAVAQACSCPNRTRVRRLHNLRATALAAALAGEAAALAGEAAALAAEVAEGLPASPAAVPRADPAAAASAAGTHRPRSLPASATRAKARVDRTAHGPAAAGRWSFQVADSPGWRGVGPPPVVPPDRRRRP